MYDRTLKAKRDWNNMLSYAKEQAEEKGKVEGKIEIAIALFSEGFSIDKIATITGLTMEQLQSIHLK
jgi:predicted transposase/invertase (TIGR01784 family)